MTLTNPCGGMKQIVCEMCDGKELVKQNGVFVCQICYIYVA